MRYARDSFSVEAAAEKGRELPQWFLEEPVMQGADSFYMRAFWDLSSCRSIGMGTGPIPWNIIVTYGERYGLDEDTLETFIYVIRGMDKEFLNWCSEEEKRRNGENK